MAVPASGSGSSGKPASRERGLIEGALRQVAFRPASTHVPPPRIALDQFPGYEITKELHRGGQGVVYQALQKSTKRKVAIKVVKEGPFAGAHERLRFEREVHILGQLQHPNIVRIHDSGEVAGQFFYVMDYVSGQGLDGYMKSRPEGRLGVDETLKLFGQICSAVSAAHLKGVIHRDLKPSNIRIDQGGAPIVLDFGLAKVMGSEAGDLDRSPVMTMTGQFVGSLPWASPEQAEGAPEKLDIRTDVYSLGVILYQMLTGKFPYEVVGNMRDVLDNILRAEPAKPSTIRKQVDDEVETIVMKCLSKERDRRYQSAGELWRDVERYLVGEPIEAKRDSGWYVVSKALRRYKAPVSVAAGFVALSVVSAIALGVMYQQKAGAERVALARLAEVRVARDAEEQNRQRADENFDHAREMARTFMNDVGDTLENLRGATKAREILLTTAREYLAKLNVQAGDRIDLLRDLADAHERVGELQGGLHSANTGASDDAAVSFAASRRIREEILQRVPGESRSHADMARSLGRSAGSLVVGKKYAQAVLEYAGALRAWDAAIGLSKDAADAQRLRDSRAQTLVRQANATYLQVDGGNAAGDGEERVQAALGMYEEAATYWRARLEGAPNDPRPTRWLGIVEDAKCRAHVWLANAWRDSAAKIIDKDRAAAKARLGKAIERYAFARSKADAALQEFRSLAAGAAANADFARDQYLALHNIGVTWMEQSEALTQLKNAAPEDATIAARTVEADRAALANFEQALAIAEGLSSADLANIEAVRDVVICLNKVGNQKLALGDLTGASSAYDQSLEVRRGLVQTDPTPMHRRDLGLALFKRGGAFMKEGDAAAGGGPGTKTQKYQAAERLLVEAERVFNGLREDGVRDQGGDDLGKTRERLAGIRKVLGQTGGN